MADDIKYVLVTGGAGYVGSHTVLELLNDGHNVIVLDNFANAVQGSNGLPESIQRVIKIADCDKKVVFYKVDILDMEALRSVFRKHTITSVVHFAALKAIGDSVARPLCYYRVNLVGSLNLMEVMKEFGVMELVFSSSATVYGAPKNLPLDENQETGTTLTNPYGRSKHFVEQIIMDVASSNKKWNIIILRYFNPIGAHESGRIGEDPSGIPNNLMPYLAQVAVGKREELKVFGNDYDTHDGTGVRDYIHVVDLALGHIFALKKLAQKCGLRIYNLGTGEKYSVFDIVKAFEKASGKKIKYHIVGRRPGDIAACYSDVTLAKKELGWTATRDMDKMCEDQWRWQSMNPDGYSS